MNEIRVVHINKSRKTAQYLGRAMPARGLPGSPLANPFRLSDESQRDAVITQYQQWFEQKLTSNDSAVRAEFERLYQLAIENDLELACWCAPKRCHCDVVKDRLERTIRFEALQNLG